MTRTIFECQCRPIDGSSAAICGKPANWLATHRNGVVTLFCWDCKGAAWERKQVILWNHQSSFSQAQEDTP